MKVHDVMTRDVQSCRPETNLATAAMQMWKGDFGALPVVSPAGKVIGMITDRDICIAAATKNRDPGDIRVKEVMSGQVYACSPDTDIHQAIKIMQEKRVRRLPIRNANDGKLVGILSMNDLALRAEGGIRAELSPQDVENTLRAICTRRSPAAGEAAATAGRANGRSMNKLVELQSGRRTCFVQRACIHPKAAHRKFRSQIDQLVESKI